MRSDRRRLLLLLLAHLCLLSACADVAAVPQILRNALWTVAVQPSTLEVTAHPVNYAHIQISAAQTGLGPVHRLAHTGNSLHWELPARNAFVSIQLNRDELSVSIRSNKGGDFTWPVVSCFGVAKAIIWPRWEGCYIPLDDLRWRRYLVDYGEWDTLEGLTMPFWGMDCGGCMLTCIVTNRYNNSIRFRNGGRCLTGVFTHHFPSARAEKQYGFRIHLSRNSSPIEPARQFRQYLMRTGAFVNMRQKLKAVPKAERLLGAPDVYLWGDGFFTRHDVPRSQWIPLCRKMVAEGASPEPSVGRRIHDLMDAGHWKAVEQLAGAQWADDYSTRDAAEGISALLQRPGFYAPACWKGIALPDEAVRLLKRPRSSLSVPELCQMNGLLLRAAYPDAVLDVKDWGDGVSLKMLKALQLAGFDRARLCVAGWSGVEQRPEVAAEADRVGYLFGVYDSFHSIHNPALRGTASTWDTAQFGQKLYETGAIVGADGRKLHGFKGKGYLLSPVAARPYVEQRVRERFRRVPYSYYFVDCDAFGQVYDDYSPLHPASQAEDVSARCARLTWIGRTFHTVVGSEGGSSYAAPVVHLVEGAFAPDIGWGDPDMKDRSSKFFTGAYYPPDGPKCFMQPVPLKDDYSFFYYDPRFRLPLYEVVFHDSVVSGHHWSSSSLKYTNVVDTVVLTELLYQVPPLYHLNLDEFARQCETLKKHYAFFSPLHRQLGFQPLTDFRWLTPDRMVQRTTFGTKAELVANYGAETFRYRGGRRPCPEHSGAVAARRPDSGVHPRLYAAGLTG